MEKQKISNTTSFKEDVEFLRFWVDKRMKYFNDVQYDKGKIRDIVERMEKRIDEDPEL